MITRDDIVKVMDFGIAKRQGATGATKASTSIGSPLYMAPEQILGRAVDCRTDVYALGITLYQLLSGQPPFNPRGKTEYVVLNAHVNDLPEPPTVYCRDIPQPIVDAVMRSLAKEPDARFQSADDFMRALPDVPAPSAAAPRVGPSGTVAHTLAGIGWPTGTVAIHAAGGDPTLATARGARVLAVNERGFARHWRAQRHDGVRVRVLDSPRTRGLDGVRLLCSDAAAGVVPAQLRAVTGRRCLRLRWQQMAHRPQRRSPRG